MQKGTLLTNNLLWWGSALSPEALFAAEANLRLLFQCNACMDLCCHNVPALGRCLVNILEDQCCVQLGQNNSKMQDNQNWVWHFSKKGVGSGLSSEGHLVLADRFIPISVEKTCSFGELKLSLQPRLAELRAKLWSHLGACWTHESSQFPHLCVGFVNTFLKGVVLRCGNKRMVPFQG